MYTLRSGLGSRVARQGIQHLKKATRSRAFASRPLAAFPAISRTFAVAQNSTVLRANSGAAGVVALQIRHYADYPSHVELLMPALSPTMTTGNLVKWTKKVGDQIIPGDVLAEVETDKATVDYECQEEGYLAKIIVPEGTDNVPINQLCGILVEDEDDIAAFENYEGAGVAAPAAAQAAPAAAAPAAAPVAAAPVVTAAPAAQSGGRVFASPLARRAAEEKGLDLNQVAGTGPNNRIIKADVDEAQVTAAAPAAAVAAAPVAVAVAAPVQAGGVYTDIPLTNMRKAIASRLLESKTTIPHYYLTMDCQVDSLMAVRKELNAQGNDEYKLSVNDFVIKASALAMKAAPAVNSSWMDDKIREYHNVDISIAVATPNGLITPIVPNAHHKGLASISNKTKELAARARDNKLQPDEFIGGTFTISNLGMFGITNFSAIINPPQSCILAVGGARRVLVPSSTPAAEGEDQKFETAHMMNVTLSCDHRVVDGAVGAQWLQAFKKYIENPMSMLL